MIFGKQDYKIVPAEQAGLSSYWNGVLKYNYLKPRIKHVELLNAPFELFRNGG
jgi:hypothetical protein